MRFKKLFIECHPDRHGGDTTALERFFKLRNMSNSKHNIKRCRTCGVRVGALAEDCRLHVRKRPLLALTACLLLLPIIGQADSLTYLGSGSFGWDRSTDDRLTNGVTYRFYSSTVPVSGPIVAITNFSTGTNISVTLTNIAPALWFYTVSAIQAGLESTNNPSLYYEVPAVPPRPPGKMFMIHMQATFNFTNFTDMGSGFRGILNVYP